MSSQVFHLLRAVREFEKRQLVFLEAVEDLDILIEIGLRQEMGAPLTLKELLLANIASSATVQRRLRRLRRHGVVRQKRSAKDRRNVELEVSARFLKALARYAEVLTSAARAP